MARTALITGITGQDGSYLAKYLLTIGYKVYGLVRRTSTPPLYNLDFHGITERIHLIPGDLADTSSLIRAITEAKPDELYNLAAMSYVQASFCQPLFTSDLTGLGAVRVFEAVKYVNPNIKVYQASSSEMFGKVLATPQSETTPFNPQSPYAAAKVYSHQMARIYREAYNLRIYCGILFNHESPLRSQEFVTRKITNAVARIKSKLQSNLILGNLDAKRDWGWAEDFVQGIWSILQHDTPTDFVLATGETHSVREWVEEAFNYAGVSLTHVETSRSLYRPAEVDLLLGDASKARQLLGWKPTVGFREIIHRMVDHDLAIIKGHLS